MLVLRIWYYIHNKLCSRAETFLRFLPFSLSFPFLLCAKLLTALRTVEISLELARFRSSDVLIVVLFFGLVNAVYMYAVWLQCALCFPLRKTALTWSAAHCKHILLVSLHITTPTIQSWLLFHSLEFSSIQLMVLNLNICSCWKFCVYVYLLYALSCLCVQHPIHGVPVNQQMRSRLCFFICLLFCFAPTFLSLSLPPPRSTRTYVASLFNYIQLYYFPCRNMLVAIFLLVLFRTLIHTDPFLTLASTELQRC